MRAFQKDKIIYRPFVFYTKRISESIINVLMCGCHLQITCFIYYSITYNKFQVFQVNNTISYARTCLELNNLSLKNSWL